MDYGTTELEQQTQQKIECREIVKRLVDFGLTEFQKVWLIKLISMELENIDLMKKITSVIKDQEASEHPLTQNEQSVEDFTIVVERE